MRKGDVSLPQKRFDSLALGSREVRCVQLLARRNWKNRGDAGKVVARCRRAPSTDTLDVLGGFKYSREDESPTLGSADT
jgi:hypothetical protein